VERKVAVAPGKIRVMHLCSYIGYDGPSRGILGQAKYGDQRRFHTTICELKPTRYSELIPGIFNMGCGHQSLSLKKVYDVSIVWRLTELLQMRKIDILNTHNTLPCWYGNIAARIAKIPVVFTLRNLQSENYKYILKRSFYYKPVIVVDSLLMRRADRIVAVSHKLRDYYVKNIGIPDGKIIAISNAIDLEPVKVRYDTQSIAKDIGIDQGSITVGIVGDLIERKGHACLIDAAKTIIQTNSSVRFLVVGDGPLKENLLSRIKAAGLSGHFIFTGHVRDVVPLLSLMDIFVLPSLAEGISRALMESMAMGIPSICSSIDGNVEAVEEGETGFLFEPGNARKLAEKLLLLIDDAGRRREMGRRAKERAERLFDMKDAAQQYQELYVKVLKERNGKVH